MKKKRLYQGVEISNRQGKVIDFLQKGNNNFWEAFSQVKHKNVKIKSIEFCASWFNRTLKQLNKKGLFLDMPFVYLLENGDYIWSNPGIKGSKANFTALTLQDAKMELKAEINKII